MNSARGSERPGVAEAAGIDRPAGAAAVGLHLDDRPEVPRVARPVSLRAGVIASIAVHAAGVLAILFGPAAWLDSVTPAALELVQPPAIRYVHLAPMVDRTDLARPEAPASDRDRRSRTRQRAAAPDNPLPFSQGQTPERIEGATGDKPIEATPPVAAPPEPPAAPPTPPDPPPVDVKISPDGLLSAPAPGVPSLRQALRGLRNHFRSQNFDNDQGGGTQPGTDIQFDSKGVDFGPWLRRFRAQIYRNWFVPQAAMVHKGRVVITFNVHRNGRITDLQVIQPASTDSFNTSAATALRLSSPTLPLPDAYPLDTVFFTVTFHYNER